MSAPERPPSLDPVAAARWSAHPVGEASPWLHEEVASRMQERLDFIKLQPERWVHWEPWRGGLQAQRALQKRYPKAEVWLTSEQPAEAMAAREVAQARWWQAERWFGPRIALGLPPAGQAQMLWANMLLHTCAQPQQILKIWHNTLAVDGFLMFSCLGPDSLRELREAYARQGWPAPAHEFTDMHDWGDMLVQAGFAEPVMDMERITLTYADADSLLAECRLLGRNLHRERFAGLRGKRWLAQLKTALLALAKPQQDGRLTLTVEVIYGHALKPIPRLKVQSESTVSLQDMRTLLSKK